MNMQRVLQLMAEKGVRPLPVGQCPGAAQDQRAADAHHRPCAGPQHAPHPAGRGADAEQLEELDQTGELNIGIGIPKVGSFRLSGFKQRNSIAAVVRCMPVKIPRSTP
jgi:twitching motility protein PilU